MERPRADGLIDGAARTAPVVPPPRAELAPLRVIYIEGFGRSGTTLLDAVLGQITGFFSLGEVAYLWDRALLAGETCGCGEPASRCPIWSVVLDAVRLTVPEVSTAHLAHWRDHALRVREIPLAATGSLDRRVADRSGPCLRALSLLYDTVATISGARVLVDSSKSAAYGYLLGLLPDVAVHTVHVVRDPRAVAFSWQRHRPGQRQPARPVGETARGWAVEEALAGALRGITHARSRTVVRYEDLVADPAREIRRILADAGEDDRALEFLRPGAVTLGPNHLVAGNPSRFHHGTVDLTPDTEWESAMSRGHVATVTATCLPWIARYHYPVFPGGERGLGRRGAL